MTDTISPFRISEHAARIARIYDLGSDTAVDVAELVRTLGGTIDVVAGALEGEHAIGGRHALTVRGKGDFTVSLQPLTSSAHDRFEMAASVGRYLLHWRRLGLEAEAATERRRDYPYSSGEGWTEGYHFAMALLMPEDTFRRVHLEHGGDTVTIAGAFDVPTSKVTARASGLKLPLAPR